MPGFEKKVSDIFGQQAGLSSHFPELIVKIFNENMRDFKKRLRKESEEDVQSDMMLLHDIAFIDYFYNEIDDLFLRWVVENHAGNFEPEELGEMEAQAESHLDFYQVLETSPGKGSLLQSLGTQNVIFVNDISSSHSLVKWDVFLGRCYAWKDKYYMTGAGRMFPADSNQYITGRLAEEFEEYRKRWNDDDYGHFAKDSWELFFQIDREITNQLKHRKVYTSFGELDPKDLIFNVINLKSALDDLQKLPEFRFLDQDEKRGRKNRQKRLIRYRFEWNTFGHEHTIEEIRVQDTRGYCTSLQQLDDKGRKTGIEYLGDLSIDAELMRLTVLSRQLAEYAKERLPLLLHHSIRFKRITGAQRSEESKNSQPNPSIDPDIEDEITREYFNSYHAEILDTPIPSLNNLTPREARNDANALPLLLEWIKQGENIELRAQKRGEPALSTAKLKKDLDLEGMI